MPRRIPTHRPAGSTLGTATTRRAYERRDDRKEDKAFYKSPAWRRLRLAFLREHPLCADCERIGLLTAAEHVHHTLERKDRPDLALDWDNLEGLCPPCHNRKRGADPS